MRKEQIEQWMPKAEKWIREHEEELIRDIQELVQIPSVSRPEQAAPGAPFGPECRRVLDRLLEMGAEYGFRTRNMDGWGGAVSMGDEGNALGIVAHLDVVPVGDGWVYPPFEAVYLAEQDAIIGRGGDDNKGPAVAGLFLMRMIRELGIPMRHGIRLYGGVSEENGMMDMQHLRETGEAFPKLSLVPDAGFPVNYGQKGSLNGTIEARAEGNLISFRAGSALNIIPDLAECEIVADMDAVQAALEQMAPEKRRRIAAEAGPQGVRIRASGVSGHAASPDSSVNAIHLLAEVLTETELLTGNARDAVRGLCELTADAYGISEGAAFEDEISGKTTLVYSMADMRDGRLEIGLDCRYSIQYAPETLREKLEAAWGARGYRVKELSVTRPFYIPKDDSRVKALQEVYQAATGREDPPYTMGGGTYSRVVPDAISFGFGLPGQQHDMGFLPAGHGFAHGRDEVLWMEKIRTGMKIYLAALLALDEVMTA